MKEALNSDQSKEWKEAADAEYGSILQNETWDLLEVPPGRKPIGCKWVFKVKHTSKKPTVIMEDNQGAVHIAKNQARTKHIDIRYHYIREALSNGTVDFNIVQLNT